MALSRRRLMGMLAGGGAALLERGAEPGQIAELINAAISTALTARGAEAAQETERDYRGAHTVGLRRLATGDYRGAVAFFEEFVKANPNDAEGLFGLAAAAAHTGNLARAMEAVQRALAAGLPPARFVAGPRAWLAPLVESQAFQELWRQRGAELVHGPMLGCVTDSAARFWVRTAAEAQVEVVVSTSPQLEPLAATAAARTARSDDFTTVLAVSGLRPDTAYHYAVRVGGKPAFTGPYPVFRTFPPPGGKARFQVGFGGGAAYYPPNERMWDTVLSHKPLAFLFLGDNIYIDAPQSPDLQRYGYYRRQSRPEFRRLTAATAIYAVWDDHDFATNDCIPGPAVDQPPWKPHVWRLFRENWNNPAYGGGEKQPGCWFDFAIGDVDFFLTDSRYYRTDPRQPKPSMLGPAQKQWLLERLKASKATFKVLANGVPWALGAKPRSRDTWEGYKEEREEIFAFIETHRIGGVVLLSADRHRSDLWRLERDVGYPLHEFESSRLTNQHVHGKVPGALFSYNEKQSFGLLTFDTTKPDPEVTYEIYSIDDERVHAFTLKRSQLTPRQ